MASDSDHSPFVWSAYDSESLQDTFANARFLESTAPPRNNIYRHPENACLAPYPLYLNFAQSLEPDTYSSTNQHQTTNYQRSSQSPLLPMGLITLTSPLGSPSTHNKSEQHDLEHQNTSSLQKKNTKRRKRGPCRFSKYTPGTEPLPADVTTEILFSEFPNHVTDDDYEELWRLGYSARRISDLLPFDTRFNEEGELVRQHHSLIQKKFKKFLGAQERREAADNTPRRFNQGAVHPIARHGGLQSSTWTRPSELPDINFRQYPLRPDDDKAFQSRMSIELAKAGDPPAGFGRYEHEMNLLITLVQTTHEKHVRFMTRHLNLQPMNLTNIDVVPNAGLSSQIDMRLARLYDRITLAITSQYADLARCIQISPTANHSIHRLFYVLQDVFYKFETLAPPSHKSRMVFNFQHQSPLKWKAHARTLYYLVKQTDGLISGQAVGELITASLGYQPSLVVAKPTDIAPILRPISIPGIEEDDQHAAKSYPASTSGLVQAASSSPSSRRHASTYVASEYSHTPYSSHLLIKSPKLMHYDLRSMNDPSQFWGGVELPVGSQVSSPDVHDINSLKHGPTSLSPLSVREQNQTARDKSEQDSEKLVSDRVSTYAYKSSAPALSPTILLQAIKADHTDSSSRPALYGNEENGSKRPSFQKCLADLPAESGLTDDFEPGHFEGLEDKIDNLGKQLNFSCQFPTPKRHRSTN